MGAVPKYSSDSTIPNAKPRAEQSFETPFCGEDQTFCEGRLLVVFGSNKLQMFFLIAGNIDLPNIPGCH